MVMRPILIAMLIVFSSAHFCRAELTDGPLAGRYVVIDPGHGAGYSGNRGGSGESRYNHWAAVYLAESLRERGATVYLTPSFLSPTNRADVANRMGADLLISIHGDDSPGYYGKGVQTLYDVGEPYNDQRSKNLAQTMQDSLISSLGSYGPNDGKIHQPGDTTAYTSLGVLSKSHVPTVLVEIGMAPGNMRNAIDAEVKMMSSSVMTRLIDTTRVPASVEGMRDGIERFFNGSQESSKQNSPGGVLLGKPAEVLFDIGNIQAAMFDRAAAQFIIIGDRETLMPATSPDYLRVGLNCAISRDGPGVSIDPGTTAGQMDVRYIGPAKGTSVGYVMFEADRLLKSLSLGYDNITRSKMICPVDGFKSIPDMTPSVSLHKSGQEGAFLRFWFVPRRVTVELDRSGNAAVFKEVSIELKAEVLDPNEPESVHRAATEFARFFTEHYDQFATEYSILTELKQVAQAVALARWIVDERIPIPSSLLNFEVKDTETPSKTPAIAVGLNTNGIENTIFKIVGGVDFSSPEAQNNYVHTIKTSKLCVAALMNRPKKTKNRWTFTSEGKQYVGIIFKGGFLETPNPGTTHARTRILIAVGVALMVFFLGWLKRSQRI